MRKVLDFNKKWAFSKEADKRPEKMPDRWEWVNLPHTWNNIDGIDGGNDYYRGTCYYAKEVDKTEFLPEAEEYYLEFQGANSSATLYVNGKEMAVHHGGYSTWRVNVTEEFKKPGNPFVLVEVDNSANETVYPQMADFTFYGGLYRDVKIICVSQSHFDLAYFGSQGIMVTPIMEGRHARIQVEVFLTGVKEGQTLTYKIKSAKGRLLAERTVDVSETNVNVEIDNVHLWNGVEDPYLYRAEVTLNAGAGVVEKNSTIKAEKDKTEKKVCTGEPLDQVSTRFGCRTFSIDPEKGFFLNGKSYPLHGVSRHQDRLDKGNALSREDHVEDMDLICEMGANTIRLAHYQHDQFFYNLCDERGMVVWAEIPYISNHMPGGRENTISQMKELVIQNYNHPSIVVWGLSNEISMKGSSEDLVKNHEILNDLCHELDATRPTVIAAVSMCDIHDPYIQVPDVVSYNHYFGWYGGDTSMNGPWFDNFHKEFPDIPIGVSEYGCEGLNWHTSNPTQGDYTEEYQAYYHEELIKQLFTRPYLWATHVWNMFDFGADARAEGGENGQNHKGLVTMDRKYKKDAFYAYKAWLSHEPFVHICGKRYVDRVEDLTRVTVYSNQPQVELFANGNSLGKQKSDVHFFYFDVPNDRVTLLKAVAGDCVDESVIRKVSKFNENYRLQEKGAILNWFDVEMPDGFYSLNDKIGDIMKAPEGKALFESFMGTMMAGAQGGMADMMPADGMISMMGGTTVLRLAGMLGMMNINMTKEQLLELNKKLNQIPRVE